MFLALELNGSLDLSQYSRLLWQQKLSHHIVEQGEQQLVLVAQAAQIPQARELFRQWQTGEVKPQAEDSSSLGGFVSGGTLKHSFAGALMQAPLTVLLMAVCIVLSVLAPLQSPTALTEALLYPDFALGTSTLDVPRILANFTFAQFLKMLSPILLHGGLVHLVFNMVWLWELGRRIERVQSSLMFALTIVVIALFSNTAQYVYGGDDKIFAGANLFGGMSGVIYGLFAYIWCWQLFDPRKGLGLPGALIFYMVASLLVFTWLGLDMIANAAHMGGFLTGMIYGAIVALASRMLRVTGETQP